MKLFSVINLSKESPQHDAWAATPEIAVKKIDEMKLLGADFIDLGARSSGSKTLEIDETIEQQRLQAFFKALPPEYSPSLSLDTWSTENALKYLPRIAVLNYTSTYFPDPLISELVNTSCPLVVNYLPAANPYALRKLAYTPPSIKAIIEYFSVTVPYLEKKGINILAIDPNLGMWHPKTPDEIKPAIQKQLIEAIPELKKIAPVFIVAPRTQGILNAELTTLILSQEADFIRTHDLVALKQLQNTLLRTDA